MTKSKQRLSIAIVDINTVLKYCASHEQEFLTPYVFLVIPLLINFHIILFILFFRFSLIREEIIFFPSTILHICQQEIVLFLPGH